MKRETTTLYTPEQNGVVERKNCSIVEVVRAMLYDEGLPKFLWVEAANIAVYVKTDALIKHWTPRRPNKCLHVRYPTSIILEFLEAPYIFMCRKRKEANWVHLERKESLWAIGKILRDVEFMSLVKRKLR